MNRAMQQSVSDENTKSNFSGANTATLPWTLCRSPGPQPPVCALLRVRLEVTDDRGLH